MMTENGPLGGCSCIWSNVKRFDVEAHESFSVKPSYQRRFRGRLRSRTFGAFGVPHGAEAVRAQVFRRRCSEAKLSSFAL